MPSPNPRTSLILLYSLHVYLFIGSEPALEVSRLNTRRKKNPWIDKHHMAKWRVLTGIPLQPRKLILGPSATAKITLLSCNRIKSRVVTALLTDHNTLRRHLYIMGLKDNSLYRRCGAELETSAHVMFECEVSASFWRNYSGCFSLDLEDIRILILRAICNFIKGTGLQWLGQQFKGNKRAC